MMRLGVGIKIYLTFSGCLYYKLFLYDYFLAFKVKMIKNMKKYF